MGRTFRKRKRKICKPSMGHTLEDENELIQLKRWITSNGFTKIKKMSLYDFAGTGRGIMALEKVISGDILMEFPLNLILSFISLECDNFFKCIFVQPSGVPYMKRTFKCQELMAFYIALLKINKCNVFWKNYVNTFPDKFYVPYFCTDAEILLLDESIRFIVHKQRECINHSFSNFQTILSHCSVEQTDLANMKSKFTLDIYSWAYFAVNSRCVYLDPVIINQLLERLPNNRFSFSLVNLLIDEPCLGLIPYLDMFNHSEKAENSAKLSYEHIPLSFKHESRKLPIFRLISLSSYPKYNQIFINYGKHCNLKLLTEYGFCLPTNDLNQITFQFNNICNVGNSSTLSKKQYQFITKQNIDKNLSLDVNGFSYNLLRLLFICTTQNNEISNAKLFSSNYNEEEMCRMLQFVYPMLVKRLNICCNALLIDDNPVIKCCKMLMKNYITIIEQALSIFCVHNS